MGMNYTKTLRSFCLQNKGKVLDSAELHKQYFEFVPYKTFLKVLNRLRDEGLLIAIDMCFCNRKSAKIPKEFSTFSKTSIYLLFNHLMVHR